MGGFISRFWFMVFPAKEYKIIVVGLDNAGKTTTLYKLHLGEVVTTNPTVGSNVEELVYKNIRFEYKVDLCGLVVDEVAKEYKIIVVGLDNAGKTTTLYKLHLGEVVTTNPTDGNNVEELVYKNIQFEVWDLGGQERLRTSWATYYRGTHAVIVVIDSSDRARISTMKDELFRLLPHEDLANAVVLVFANKQDLKDAMTPAEITDALSLHSIKNHDWHIQACSALTGDGLYDGLGWIAQKVPGKTPT
ncbi:ADP-ribosylation factor-like protein 5 [Capsicum annuum]|nr:ADP-ribosylation factor-like protein 5 [Capsicum annuum]